MSATGGAVNSGLINVISHTDLDGVVAAAVAWHANQAVPVKISLTGYGEVDNLILEGLRRGDQVVTLDLYPQFQNTVDEIDKIVREGETIIFDHHQSSLDKIGRRSWAAVDTSRCAASVYWHWLMESDDAAACSLGKNVEALRDIVTVANDRDLWINENPNGRLWQAMVTMCGEHGVFARLASNPSAVMTKAERELAVRFTAAQEERFKRARDSIVFSRTSDKELAFLGDGHLEFGDASDFCGSILDDPKEKMGSVAMVALAFRRPSRAWAVSLRSRNGLAGSVTSLLKDGRNIRGGGHDNAAALYFPASYNEKSIRESILAALAAKAESSAGTGVTLGDLLKNSAR